MRRTDRLSFSSLEISKLPPIGIGILAFFAFNKEARNLVQLAVLGRLHELGPVDPRTVLYYKDPEHFTFVKITFFQTLTQLLFPVIRKVEEEGHSQQQKTLAASTLSLRSSVSAIALAFSFTIVSVPRVMLDSFFASNLLPEGRTIASYFKLNISANCKSSSSKPNTVEGQRMKEVDISVLDECSMLSDKVLHTIDVVLRDLMSLPSIPFGGKTILMGGDFRQVLLIPNKLYGSDPYSYCLKVSPLFTFFKRIVLTENMRAVDGSDDFKKFLLGVGEDKLGKDEEGKIQIPQNMLSGGNLIHEVFEGVFDDPDHLAARAILCPLNVNVDKINQYVVGEMSGAERVFLSADKIEKDDDRLLVPDEFLNSLNLPPHRLNQKKGCIVMLLRNLNVKRGLCNGTRLQVHEFEGNSAIECLFINGTRKGEKVVIPRIDLLSTKEKGLSFSLRRRQFPLKMAFAMTVNKSQGQSFDKVGVFLPQDVFSHGQLYVALSRARSMEGLKVHIMQNGNKANIVDRRALE